MWCKSSAVAAALAFASPAEAAPANSLSEMFSQLGACLHPVRFAEGTDVTILFSVNRSGGLIGKPRFTHAHWAGDDAAQQASADSLRKGLEQCFPLAITDALGGAIAGRTMTFRLEGVDQRKA